MAPLSQSDQKKIDKILENITTIMVNYKHHDSHDMERFERIEATLRDIKDVREADVTSRKATMRRVMWLLVSCGVGIFMLIVKTFLAKGLSP